MTAHCLPTADAVPGLSWLAQKEVPESQSPCLVVAWSFDEPHRLGESAILGFGVSVLGRGPSQPGDPGVRLMFGTDTSDASALGGAGVSRVHVLLERTPEAITFERRGRALLRLNGKVCSTGALSAGDVLTIDKQLVLLCVSRATAGKGPPRHSAGQFGRADTYGLVGESDACWMLRERLAQAARSREHILLLGPSGSGKELCARALHGMSGRGGAFVSRNAATFPATLIDAELFGNVRGFPNTGTPERIGLIGAASGGMLFLDEIGDLAQELSSHLLRVLDRGGEYQQLGESQSRHADLRLVAATNRSLSTLKSDFAARFLIRIEVPSLDERLDDVPLIVRHLLEEMSRSTKTLRDRFFDQNTAAFRIDPEFMEVLLRTSYGELNVRKLSELLWRSVQESRVPYLRPPAQPNEERASARVADAHGVRRAEPTAAQIRDALAQHEGKPSRASRALGLSSRFALYRLMRKHGIHPDDETAASGLPPSRTT